MATPTRLNLEDITSNIVQRKTTMQKLKGLMFTTPIQDEAHIFFHNKTKKHTYHMSFVFYPIDILFLKEDIVVDMKQDFLPFSTYTPKKPCDKAIELPRKTIRKHNVKRGDTITH